MIDVTGRLSNISRDVLAVDEKIAGLLVQIAFYNTTQTTKNSSVTLFALDATGGTIRNIVVEFYLAADAAATFTPTVYKTRSDDLTTFTQEVIPTMNTIVNPASARKYRYECGDLAQGLQFEFRLEQDNAGNANNDVEATLTCLREV